MSGRALSHKIMPHFYYKMAKSIANQYCLNGIRSVGMYKIRPGEIAKILDNGSVSCKRYRYEEINISCLDRKW